MFPFKPGHFAPLNRWYVAAFSEEVGRTPVERWICNEPVAFYRREKGTPVAVDGRCPHHMFPLAKGTLVGDNIRCGYHGLVFAPDGACVASPFLDKIPRSCRIRSYPLVEKWQWLWIWPGDPALADEALLPDHDAILIIDPAFDTLPGEHLDIAARAQLINDNLLDLQHLEVLHAAHIGNDGFGSVEEVVTSGEAWIESNRLLVDVGIPPVMANWFGNGRANREAGMRYHAPGLHAGWDIFTGAPDSGRAGEHLGRINVYHAVTPGRHNRCHYFTAIGRDFARGDRGFDAGMLHKLAEVVKQDVVAAEAIEAMIETSAAPSEMLFRSDATLVAGRRMLQRMMDGEATPTAASA